MLSSRASNNSIPNVFPICALRLVPSQVPAEGAALSRVSAQVAELGQALGTAVFAV